MSLARPNTGLKAGPEIVRTQVGQAGGIPPFAMLPHAVASDHRLTPTERLAVAALLYWACDRPRCTPSNRQLADYLGVDPSTVKRALTALEAAGWIRCERSRPDARNPTGRVVVLRWRQADDGPQPAPARRPVVAAQPEQGGPPAHRCAAPGGEPAPAPGAPVPPLEDVRGERIEKGGRRDPDTHRISSRVERSGERRGQAPELSPERRAVLDEWMQRGGILAEQARKHLASLGTKPPARPASPRPMAGMVGRAMSSTGDPATLEALARLGPGCDRGAVDRGVRHLCREFKPTDRQDFQRAYEAVLNDVRSGSLPADLVVNAYLMARGPMVRNPGAAFAAAIQKG